MDMRVLAVTFAALALMGSSMTKGVPVYAEEAHCKADLSDLYRLHTDIEVVAKRTPGSSDDEETTVDELLEDLNRLNDKRCIQIPTWSDDRFAGHWMPATSSEVERIKTECEKYVEHEHVGSFCAGFTTTRIERVWKRTQCRVSKRTVVNRTQPALCTKQGVPFL